MKDQDIFRPIAALASHAEGTEAVFIWMTENWDELSRRLPAGLSMLGRIVSMCTSYLASEDGLRRVQKFFEDKSTKGFDQNLAQSCDSIRARIAWLGRDREDVKSWVDAYQGKGIKSEL